MTHIKTVKVTNPKNVIVQIPGFIVGNWGLTKEDGVSVHLGENGEIIMRPNKQRRVVGKLARQQEIRA